MSVRDSLLISDALAIIGDLSLDSAEDHEVTMTFAPNRKLIHKTHRQTKKLFLLNLFGGTGCHMRQK